MTSGIFDDITRAFITTLEARHREPWRVLPAHSWAPSR